MRQQSPALEIQKTKNTAQNKNRQGYRRRSNARTINRQTLKMKLAEIPKKNICRGYSRTRTIKVRCSAAPSGQTGEAARMRSGPGGSFNRQGFDCLANSVQEEAAIMELKPSGVQSQACSGVQIKQTTSLSKTTNEEPSNNDFVYEVKYADH